MDYVVKLKEFHSIYFYGIQICRDISSKILQMTLIMVKCLGSKSSCHFEKTAVQDAQPSFYTPRRFIYYKGLKDALFLWLNTIRNNAKTLS